MLSWNDAPKPSSAATRSSLRQTRRPFGRIGSSSGVALGTFILAGAVALGGIGSFGLLASFSGPGPAISASPDSGTPGTKIQVRGTSFPALVTVQLQWDDTTSGMPTAVTTNAGGFKATVIVPAAPAGLHTLSATVVSGTTTRLAAGTSNVVTTRFTITADSPAANLTADGPPATDAGAATALD
jgi:hypothetical protein